MNSLHSALHEAGRFGHVSLVRDGEGTSCRVRKGLGRWLVHVVKWHTSRTYRETIIQQRVEVLRKMSQLGKSENTPGVQSSFSELRIEQLQDHLEHGSIFQKRLTDFLDALQPRFETNAQAVPDPNREITKILAARKFATNDAALVNLRIPGHTEDIHEAVNKEKFGAAYWQYVRTKIGEPMEQSATYDGEAAGSRGLLEYALVKDENKYYQGTGLYQIATVQKENDVGIDFEAWGIPNGVDRIELRLVPEHQPSHRARRVVAAGSQGNESLAEFRKIAEAVLATTAAKPAPETAHTAGDEISAVSGQKTGEAVLLPAGPRRTNAREQQDLRNIYMKSFGMDLQLADLYSQFTQEEAGTNPLPY